MPLETATYISGLNTSYPAGSDPLGQSANHARLIKSTIQATFPNITGAVTATHTQINTLAASSFGAWTFTGAVTFPGSAGVDAEGDATFTTVTIGSTPSASGHATTKTYVDTADALKANKAITITAGGGLSGGGDLSADRTLAIASNSNGYGSRTVSSGSPSGGANGDVWYKV
jgi:hypothetical protein